MKVIFVTLESHFRKLVPKGVGGKFGKFRGNIKLIPSLKLLFFRSEKTGFKRKYRKFDSGSHGN